MATVEIVWNGPEPRCVAVLENDYAQFAWHIDDGRPVDPCDPPCEGTRSFCCGLVRQHIECDLGPALTIAQAIRLLMSKAEAEAEAEAS